jgi:hypothetical protein
MGQYIAVGSDIGRSGSTFKGNPLSGR